MAKEAFDAIMDGLDAAIAYVDGDTSKGRKHMVAVPVVDVKAARASLGLSQPAFARTFGVSVATVRNWEQQRRRPQGAARVLLHMIARDPKAVAEVIAEASEQQPAA